MAPRRTKNTNIGKTKRSTDEMIDDAINQQNEWMENRRHFTRRFLRRLNFFAKPSEPENTQTNSQPTPRKNRERGLRAYWFPIVCAILVILVAIWVIFFRPETYHRIIIVPAVPEPVVKTVSESTTPSFDIVRIDPNGTVVIAGRWVADKNVSVVINNKIVATERTNSDGEFTYAPRNALRPGNYTVSLIGADNNKKSDDRVFLYISPRGADNSMSLLMTSDGSRILQAPTILADGDLNVSKIDYLDTGRIVVSGTALPRMRVSLSLNDKYLGFARVSDHKNFGLGADVEKLTPGKRYVLTIRLHDGSGHTISQIGHSFIMPNSTGNSDTFYTVRSGDCLWIIARNFMRRGVLFSIIADRNNIQNPNLIYPKQKLVIPIQGRKQ